MMECAACSRQFGGIVGFAAHQRWDYGKPHGQQLTCLDPVTVGLSESAKGVWVRPYGKAK